MTAPLHARDVTGKGRYYGPCDNGDDCPFATIADGALLMSVTNAINIVSKPALVPAAVKVTAEYAWELLPRMGKFSRQGVNGPNGCERKRVAERCGACRFCLTAQLKAQHKNEWEHKADLGTRVHYTAADKALGRPVVIDDDVAPFIGQYAGFLAAMDVDLDRDLYAVETTVYDAERRYAGTGDVAVDLPIDPRTFKRTKGRRLWLLDIKTSLTKPADRVYADQVLQLAGLRYAPELVLVDDTTQPNPEYAGAAILNLRENDHAMIPLPADLTAHRAFVHALELQRFFHDHVDVRAWETIPTQPINEN